MTTMVIAHETGFARKVANRVIFTDTGEIAEEAPSEELFAPARTERARSFLSKILHHR